MTDTAKGRAGIPEKPSLDGIEETWSHRWQEAGTYAFDRSKARSDVYSIDTPPPTVSGELHMGHVFSYTHTDTVARFQRMRGKMVFYPMGWDDNGLPTERRVQNVYGVRGDASLPYDPAWTPPAAPVDDAARKKPTAISRRNFIELCERLTVEDERAFEELWRRLGLSVDWSLTYTTIGRHARTTSQRAFLRNLTRGEAYTAEAPTLWDVGFGTAVAQAELEDRERPGAYHRLRFHGPGDEPVYIETTRPELLPACVALVAHPDDERYAHLFGRHRAYARLRCRGAGARTPAGRKGQGHRHRDGLHVRRPGRRDLVARAAAGHPGGDRPRRAAAARTPAGCRPREIRGRWPAAPSTRRGARSSRCYPTRST